MENFKMKNEQAFEQATLSPDCCHFDNLFRRNLIHILEAIFLSLDYESLKRCYKVCRAWNEFLSSKSLTSRAFRRGLREMERHSESRKRQLTLLKTEDDRRGFDSFLHHKRHLFSKPEKDIIPDPDPQDTLMAQVLGSFCEAQDIVYWHRLHTLTDLI